MLTPRTDLYCSTHLHWRPLVVLLVLPRVFQIVSHSSPSFISLVFRFRIVRSGRSHYNGIIHYCINTIPSSLQKAVQRSKLKWTCKEVDVECGGYRLRIDDDLSAYLILDVGRLTRGVRAPTYILAFFQTPMVSQDFRSRKSPRPYRPLSSSVNGMNGTVSEN